MRRSQISRVGAATALLVLISISSATAGFGDADEEPTTWTVMAYMAADAEPALPWQDDINEMEGAALTDHVKVVALVDPLGGGNSVIYEIMADNPLNPSIVSTEVDDGGTVIPLNEVNMASAETLRRFIEFAATEYPADRLALVLWGHGAGWYGLCADQLNIMSLPSLRTALTGACENVSQEIDMVLIDSCLGGTLEMVFELSDVADVLVASETNVPYSGQRYDLVLDILARDTTQSAEDWGTKISEVFGISLGSMSLSGTMAVFDLDDVPQLESSLDELSRQLIWHSRIYGSRILRAVLEAQVFDMDSAPDAGHLLGRLVQAELPHEIVWAALDAMCDYREIVRSFRVQEDEFDPEASSYRNASGAILYLPVSTGTTYSYLQISERTQWDEAAQLIMNHADDSAEPEMPMLEQQDLDGDGLMESLTVLWEDNHLTYEVWAFVQLTHGMQLFDHVMGSCPNITVSGAIGNIVISTSAGAEGVADSHCYLTATIVSTIRLEVQLMRDEGIVHGSYVVKAHLPTETVALSENESSYVLNVAVPAMASVGDLIVLEVVDSRSGDTAGIWMLHLRVNSTYVLMEISDPEQSDSAGWYFMILSAAIACALISIGAVYARRFGGSDERP